MHAASTDGKHLELNIKENVRALCKMCLQRDCTLIKRHRVSFSTDSIANCKLHIWQGYELLWRGWGQEEKGTTEDETAGWHHWLDGRWVWVNSGRWWWTGRPGVLRFMGSQSRTQLSDWTALNWCLSGFQSRQGGSFPGARPNAGVPSMGPESLTPWVGSPSLWYPPPFLDHPPVVWLPD